MTETNTPNCNRDDAITNELREIGDEFGCAPRLPGESSEAYGLRLMEYVAEMTSELRAVEARVRELIS
jgi:hypothetical protein